MVLKVSVEQAENRTLSIYDQYFFLTYNDMIGLRLILNVQQDEYISLTGPEAGVRVTVTPRDVRPLPAQDGITIKPGVATALGLRYVST